MPDRAPLRRTPRRVEWALLSRLPSTAMVPAPTPRRRRLRARSWRPRRRSLRGSRRIFPVSAMPTTPSSSKRSTSFRRLAADDPCSETRGLRASSAEALSVSALLCRAAVWASGPISRVLSLDGHLSETPVAKRLKHATRTHGGQPCRVPICACSGWGFPSHAVADALVRSYRTVSAFLAARCAEARARGSFLFCGTVRRVAPPSR